MHTDPFASPSTRTFISQRLTLHYLDWGNEDAPDLILVHGGQDHAHNWDWIARELRGDWHIMAPDLRGHGDSDWSPDGSYTFAAYVYDLAQLIHQRARPPVTLIGHSLGGVICVRYTALYPETVRRLVSIEGVSSTPLSDPLGDDPPVAERLRDWIAERRGYSTWQRRRYATLDEARARMRQNNPHLSEAQARHLADHAVIQNEDGSFSWKFDDYARKLTIPDISRAEERALFGQVDCPTLLAYGEESWMPNPAKDGRAAMFPDARVISYPGAGHWLHHDKTAEFLADVRGFIG